MLHAVVLGLTGLALSITGCVVAWKIGPELGPMWYPIALVITTMPAAWIAGRVREIQLDWRLT